MGQLRRPADDFDAPVAEVARCDIFNGSTSSLPPSNLDNVYASKNLRFKTFFHSINGTPVEVDVRGWVNVPTAAKKDEWIGKFSDHSLLYFEIHE